MVFLAVVALSLLLPRALPGELPAGEMTPHGSAVCGACPPTEKIAAAGLALTPNGGALSVRFAATPLNSKLTILLDGVPGELTLSQNGAAWGYAGRKRAAVRLAGSAQRDDIVVFTFPADLRVSGFALKTSAGDRFPDSGFASPVYPQPPHFNASDVALLLLLAAAAWYGVKRGFLFEVADLVVVFASLAIAALAYRPAAAAISQMTHSRAAAAIIASGILLIVTGLAGFFLVRRHLGVLIQGTPPFDWRIGALLGGVAGCLRQLPVLAMVLAASADLTALHWASSNINSSLLGSALLHTWRMLFATA
jgi:uncharacterized membrane protein required for colicin V production